MDVDSEDLLREFESVAERVLTELKTKRTAQGVLSVSEDQKVAAIEKRLEAMKRSEKNVAFTLEQILKFVNGRLYKPQRLVSLTYEEEERRALMGVVEV